MTDTLTRIIARQENFFGVSCNTTSLVAEACRRHDVGPVAGAALGRALTCAVLLAALLKDDQSIALKFEGNGPLQKIITEAGYNGWARGYVANPKAELPLHNGKIDVAGGIGHAGLLTVTKDIGMKEKYQGTVELYTSEIGADVAYYLAESEQTPSTVNVGIHFEPDGTVAAAGGYIVQSLPPADEKLITSIEQRIDDQEPITRQLLAGQTPEAILSNLFQDIPHKVTGSMALTYQCSCSKEKMYGALMTLKEEELREILKMKHGVQVSCDFCRNSYIFEKQEIEPLLTSASQQQH